MNKHLKRSFELLNHLPEEFTPEAGEMVIEALREMARASVEMHWGTPKYRDLAQAEREMEALSIPAIRTSMAEPNGYWQQNWQLLIANLRAAALDRKELH